MSFIVNSCLKNGFHSYVRKIGSLTTVFCDTGSLRAKDLKDLLSSKIDCLVVEGFLQKQNLEAAQRLASGYHQDMLNLPKEYVYSGFSSEEILQNPKLEYYYHSSSMLSLSKLREESAPSITWVDKLRLELDEQSETGAKLHISKGLKYQAFIARAIGSDDQPLIQIRDLPHHFKPAVLKTQILALQYLVAPEKGGNLELFPGLLDDHERSLVYERRADILPATVPEPSTSIKAFAGRLVLLNSRIPFRFSKIEPRELSKEESKKYLTPKEIEQEKTVTKNISCVIQESFILQMDDKEPLSILR